MSGGTACRNSLHKASWTVRVYKANHSAFGGGKRQPSDWSDLYCAVCQTSWRSKSAYVDTLPRERNA